MLCALSHYMNMLSLVPAPLSRRRYFLFQLIFSAVLLLLAYIFFVAPASQMGLDYNSDRLVQLDAHQLKRTQDQLAQSAGGNLQNDGKMAQSIGKPSQSKDQPKQTADQDPKKTEKRQESKEQRVESKNNLIDSIEKMVHHQIKHREPLQENRDSGGSLRNAGSGPSKTKEIPHILHHTFASEMVYKNYRPMISSCLKLNPNWTYYLWRDSDAIALISKEYPEYLKTYLSFKDNLQRSDAIRYVILHRFGGIYLDMDVECLQPFHPGLTHLAAFIDQERLEQTRILWRRDFSAMNSVMGSVPGHPFYKAMADRVLKKYPGRYAFQSTGPLALTKFFQEYKGSSEAKSWPVTLLPPSVASPLMDDQKNWKWLCRKAKRRGSPRLSWFDKGCHMLESKNWHLGSTDKSTIVVHRFLHLGYDSHNRNRRSKFDVSKDFKSRVNFYL